MKKAIFSLFFIFLSLSLYAEIWSSNALGQKLEEKEILDQRGWEREDRDGLLILYYNGSVNSEREEFSDGYEKREKDKIERVFLDQDGKILRRIITHDEEKEEYNYNYQNGILSLISKSIEGNVIQITEYYLTKDGSLLGLTKDDGSSYFLDSRIVYSSEGSVQSLSYKDGESEEGTIEFLDNGGYLEIIGGSRIQYDGNGRKNIEEEDGIIRHYSYDGNGSLLEVREEDEKETSVSSYKDGKIVLTTIFNKDGVILRTRELDSDGTILETRYVDGKARYVFQFDVDGERILGARGL